MSAGAGVNPQREHYERIHDHYERHYYDAASMAYRHRFIYRPLLEGLDLDGARLADLACGSGHNSMALRDYYPRLRTVGYDISEAACRDYARRTGGEAHRLDLTRPLERVEPHDAACVIGGLHHCVADLGTTLHNVARMVRPGGVFLMMEPNDDFLLGALRRLWYRGDRWFQADTEEALKHDAVAALAAPWFAPERVRYLGGPAYYLILNSLILRVPLGAKPCLWPLLMPLEALFNALPGRSPFAFFVAVWRRTEAPA